MYLLGFDIGSSSVKASIIEVETGDLIASAFSPKEEMKITASNPDWAEQSPNVWVENAIESLKEIKNTTTIDFAKIKSIGISYQMHGLVLVDKKGEVLRPAIIWCDSRAVSIGNKAFNELGKDYCLEHLLNSPGNFTASKLRWVYENEPDIYKKIHKAMLPGDYFAYFLTGKISTTASGLSEGVLWNFKEKGIASEVLKQYAISEQLLPPLEDTFSVQGCVTSVASKQFGIPEGIPVSYRAGDQPNNAFSLNVLHPGEVAATGGTSGVVYGVTDQKKCDPKSRVNTFLHVNNNSAQQRLGVLLCINATGIANSWLRKNVASGLSYEEMNQEAMTAPMGSDGLLFYPFGNGSERILENKSSSAQLIGLNLNRHSRAHMLRAAQEGIVFSFVYGMKIMENVGIQTKTIKACKTNMFLSELFVNTLSTLTGATIELYNTDGSIGAARGAGLGVGIYNSFEEAFVGLKVIEEVKPKVSDREVLLLAYKKWETSLFN